jgi:DeoR/GlpR family transcriptional regulator of sugar metabolism
MTDLVRLRAIMAPEERRRRIVTAVRSGTTHVADLARTFGVSEMTVRRDLRVLARSGKLERVHGGAVETVPEPPFDEIAVERLDAKDRIGAAAAALIRDGQTVMIDIGTTTLQAARHLRGRPVTVVTTNLAVYEELVADPAIELVLSGGLVRRNYRSCTGILAEDALRGLSADVALLGTSGIDSELAVWDTTMIEVPTKRAMIDAAQRVVLLADAQKFSMTGLVRVCGADRIDHIVTDAAIPASRRASVHEAGIEVTIA